MTRIFCWERQEDKPTQTLVFNLILPPLESVILLTAIERSTRSTFEMKKTNLTVSTEPSERWVLMTKNCPVRLLWLPLTLPLMLISWKPKTWSLLLRWRNRNSCQQCWKVKDPDLKDPMNPRGKADGSGRGWQRLGILISTIINLKHNNWPRKSHLPWWEKGYGE